ncbi:hypothetical protein QVD17_11785 [Tagetes erecta]|uniref:Uncharacterized protein n=1 Tax=Tagetes erecta TaxID=13708 RepID=A0AAD8P2D0_TARER|nr:hypothetical protein QVD17_11785 [Tagetes erecta]
MFLCFGSPKSNLHVLQESHFVVQCFVRDFGGEETCEFTWTESLTTETMVMYGDVENTNVNKENVFAWGDVIKTGACWGGGEGDGVDVSGRAEDEELVVGVVEEVEMLF